MASCATTKTAAVKSFAVFVTFSVLQRCSSSSPGSVWEGNSHIARQFGFPFPFPLPKFNFSDVSEECQAIVQKLSSFSSPLFYSCEYGASNFQLFGQESRILALIAWQNDQLNSPYKLCLTFFFCTNRKYRPVLSLAWCHVNRFWYQMSGDQEIVISFFYLYLTAKEETDRWILLLVSMFSDPFKVD